MRDAGIHADRRGSPDLIGQLIQAMKRPIDTVICSLLDFRSNRLRETRRSRRSLPMRWWRERT
jgi:hypothetical protein